MAPPFGQYILALHLGLSLLQEQFPGGGARSAVIILSCAKAEQLIKIIRHKVGKASFFMFISFLLSCDCFSLIFIFAL
jgi:hypothetical protein